MPRIGPFGIWELLIILFVLLLFFGSSRLPGMARGIAESIGEFRKGIKGGQDDDESSAEPASAADVDTSAKAHGTEADASSTTKTSSATAQRKSAKTDSESDREGDSETDPDIRRTVAQGQE